MSSNSLVDNVLASISKLRRRTSLRESLRSFRSNSSTANSIKSKKETSSLRRTSSYYPYSVYEQRMTPIILRDPEATRKLLEAILDSPNGKRALSRLARTCRALSEPALNILWRDLDSIVPVIGLFPGHILKKARKPGLGLAKVPQEGDWKHVLAYSERIQRLAYDENSNAVAPSIFSILEEYRPRAYLFPNLQELSWKVETAAGLDRCQLFLNPKLESINLEVGTKIPHLNTFLEDISSRLQLVGFSFVSPTSLPDSYTKLLRRQNKLERVALVAPGALGPDVGRQVASLPQLKNLQLDLTGRSMIAVEGFFDELEPRSGDSTPSSVGSTDSGVFSGEELDFSGIRKSALRLTGDLPSKGSFSQLRRLHLTGDVSNIAVFIKHLTSPLVQLELVIEDPPDNADWQDLSSLICERFSESIQSLRITATSSSRFVDLVRSTSRAEPASGRLSLEHLTSLPALTRLDIDLPESVVFTAADIACLAKACPNLEMLRLCPLARFPQTSGPPKVTLEDLAPIVTECKRLHTLAVVFNAKQGSAEVLASRTASSPSLLRLHTGHSWISDPLQVSILLSHLAPNLESLKWFQEKNRPGFVEANAKNWQMTCDILPHLQGLRSAERAFAKAPVQIRPKMLNKGIDASVKTVNRGVIAQVRTADSSIQCTPRIVNRGIDAVPKAFSTAVDATPRTRETSIDATPLTVSTAVDASVFGVSKSVETTPISKTVTWPSQHLYLSGYLPSVLGFFSFAYRIFIFFPFSLSSRILQLALARLPHVQKKRGDTGNSVASENTPSSTVNIPLDTLQVRQ